MCVGLRGGLCVCVCVCVCVCLCSGSRERLVEGHQAAPQLIAPLIQGGLTDKLSLMSELYKPQGASNNLVPASV